MGSVLWADLHNLRLADQGVGIAIPGWVVDIRGTTALGAHTSVDPFAKQVSMAAVAGILLDHVREHLA